MRLLLVLLCWSVGAWGADVWVDLTGTGAGAADGTSYANRCAGVSDTDCFSAGVKPAAGSTVRLCGTGAAALSVTNSGSSGNVTTYTGVCTGGSPGILALTSGIPISSSNRNYLTFADLTASVAHASSVWFGYGTNLVFDNVDFSGSTGSSVVMAFSASQTSGTVTIQNSNIHGGASHCIGYQPTIASGTLGPFTIEDNEIYECGGSGIQFQTATPGWATTVWSGITVDGNTIYSTGTPINIRSGIPTVETPTDFDGCRDTNLDGTPDTPAYSTGVVVSDNHIYDSTANGLNYHCLQNSVTQNNLIHDVMVTGAAINFAGDQYSSVIGNEVYNVTASNLIDEHAYYADRFSVGTQFLRNKCHDIDGITGELFTGACIALFRAQDTQSVGNVGWNLKNGIVFNHSETTGHLAYNNTFSVVDSGVIAPDLGSGVATNGLSVINNLFVGPHCATVDADQAVWTTNACQGDYTGQTTGIGDDIAADPQFVTATPTTAEGFRLQASSPARYAGTYLGPLQDYGNRRFKFPPSIGAWESGSRDAATRSARTVITAR